MNANANLLAATLADPSACAGFGLAQWSLLIRQARVAELLGQLRARLDEAGRLAAVPPPALRHLDVAWDLSLRHRAAVKWEVGHIRDALAGLDVPVVLLKGAAYCIAGSGAAIGRVFNDVDIMVPRARLGEAEDALIRGGWLPSKVDAYDQRYYRRWMHELPPMEHKNRRTVLDVHHTIVPPTSGIVPDPAALITRARRVSEPGLEMFSVLAPEDMVIHSACHLFMGEFHKGLRDLYDLSRLFDDAAGTSGFWDALAERAQQTGLVEPVVDAMREVRRVFGLDVPPGPARALLGRAAPRALAPARAWLFAQVLRPNHRSCDSRGSSPARWFAYARAHWLRMPLPLLVYHLTHKAVFSDRG